jgi:osmotically-inducible protein OsmY
MNARLEITQLMIKSIADAATERLHASPYLLLRKVTCNCDEGLLVLTGSVPTYFHKQLAQQSVFGIKGVKQVVNQIDVCNQSTFGGIGKISYDD